MGITPFNITGRAGILLTCATWWLGYTAHPAEWGWACCMRLSLLYEAEPAVWGWACRMKLSLLYEAEPALLACHAIFQSSLVCHSFNLKHKLKASPNWFTILRANSVWTKPETRYIQYLPQWTRSKLKENKLWVKAIGWRSSLCIRFFLLAFFPWTKFYKCIVYDNISLSKNISKTEMQKKYG